MDGIVRYGEGPSGTRNLGFDVGRVHVLVSPITSENNAAAEGLASELFSVHEELRQAQAEVAALRDANRRLRAERDAGSAALESHLSGKRRFFGPVLLVAGKDGWGGEVYLQDPQKRDHGRALWFASITDLHQEHPELWVVRVEPDGSILLDGWKEAR